MPPDLFLGPAALLAAALVAIGVLWREHLKADADDRAQRDRAQELLAKSLANNAAAIEAWNRRVDQDAARRRRADRP